MAAWCGGHAESSDLNAYLALAFIMEPCHGTLSSKLKEDEGMG